MRGIGFDRIIDSDRPIAGTTDGAVDTGDSIRIVWHPARAEDDAPLWSRDGTTLDFHPPGVAHYRCTPTSIAIAPVASAPPDVPADMVEALLIATALPAVMWLNGAFLLHAAAVVAAGEDHALAIAGASGSGKSRLAATFLDREAHLVADDSVAIGPGIRCSGLAGGYHLGSPDAAERTFHPVPRDRSRTSADLGAVVILEDIAVPARLRPADAVAALLTHRHRASVPRLCGLEPRGLADAARLACAIPVFRWPRTTADRLADDRYRRSVMRGEDR